MTANDTISIAMILSVGSFVVALVGVILNARKQSKEDAEYKEKTIEAENQRQLTLTENFVKVNLKLETLTDTMNQIVVKSDKTSEEIRTITEKIIENRMILDNHEKRITELEK